MLNGIQIVISQYPFAARIYIPRPLHGFDCFTVSTLCTDIDLGSRGISAVNVLL